ncbi:MAG: aldo/keto reductase [Fimbriimonadaceae bacterium]|nr:aldo/keto reductase [Fimbriimonadaceae bacterium]
MKRVTLGQSDLQVTRLAYGCMRIAGTWNPADVDEGRRSHAYACINAAINAGYNLFDHADIYCRGECERLFGDVLQAQPGLRDRLLIATKCGIRQPADPHPDSPHRYDFSKEHILWSCEESLKRLRVDTIDLYQLHRPDALMNPEEIGEAFVRLHEQGKVRWFGVSNFYPSSVSALQAGLPFPIVVNQIEVHLRRLDPIYDGTLDQCLQKKIVPLSWSPLGGGFFVRDNDTPEVRQHAEKLMEMLMSVAEKHETTWAVIALAWLMKHPSGIIPIVGSANPDRIREMVRADEIEIDREDWYRIFVAARMERLP